MKIDKPAASGEAQRCPTCKSPDKTIRLRYEGGYPQFPYHDCDDPWHAAPVSPAPPEARCKDCSREFSKRWVGTTCSVCDGDIVAAPAPRPETLTRTLTEAKQEVASWEPWQKSRHPTRIGPETPVSPFDPPMEGFDIDGEELVAMRGRPETADCCYGMVVAGNQHSDDCPDLEQRLTGAAFPQEVGGSLVVDLGTAIDIATESTAALRQELASAQRDLETKTLEYEASQECVVEAMQEKNDAVKQLSEQLAAAREQEKELRRSLTDAHSGISTRNGEIIRLAKEIKRLREQLAAKDEALYKIVRLCEKGFKCTGTAAKDIIFRHIAEAALKESQESR